MSKKRTSQVNKEEEATRQEAFERMKVIEGELGVQFGAFIDYRQTGITPVFGCRVLDKDEKKEQSKKVKK